MLQDCSKDSEDDNAHQPYVSLSEVLTKGILYGLSLVAQRYGNNDTNSSFVHMLTVTKDIQCVFAYGTRGDVDERGYIFLQTMSRKLVQALFSLRSLKKSLTSNLTTRWNATKVISQMNWYRLNLLGVKQFWGYSREKNNTERERKKAVYERKRG